MKITFKYCRNINPDVYMSFNLIDIDFVNSVQVVALNITLFNFRLAMVYEKKRIFDRMECPRCAEISDRDNNPKYHPYCSDTCFLLDNL